MTDQPTKPTGKADKVGALEDPKKAPKSKKSKSAAKSAAKPTKAAAKKSPVKQAEAKKPQVKKNTPKNASVKDVEKPSVAKLAKEPAVDASSAETTPETETSPVAGEVKVASDGVDLSPVLEHVLHGPTDRTYTEVMNEADLSFEQAQLLWRVLGFDDFSAQGKIFNKNDVDALKAFKRAVDRNLLPAEDMYEIVRATAQSTFRLANWQASIIGKRLEASGLGSSDSPPTEEDLARVLNDIGGLRPILERLLIQVWRRQMVNHMLRSERAHAHTQDDPASSSATVAFADMVGFTRISRELEGDQLAKLVERFEQVVTLIAAESGAQLMKTIGDEVLIMSEFTHEVAEFALKLQEFAENADDFPELRIGIATGGVISQMGDIFGPTVNHASRLTAFAKPSSIYVDAATKDALESNERYRFKSTRMRAIQGFTTMTAFELRQAKNK